MNHGIGVYAAVVGTAAVILGGASAVEIIIGWGIVCCLSVVIGRIKEKGCISTDKLGIGILLIWLAVILTVLEDTFPQKSTYPFVSLGMVLLLYRQMIGEKDSGIIVRNVIGIIIIPMLVIIALCGIPDMRAEELLVQKIRWEWVLKATAVMLPLCSIQRERKWRLITLATLLGISIMTHCMLGGYLAETMDTALYKAVGTIHVSGKLIHVESLLAAIILMGGFATVSFLGDKIREKCKMNRRNAVVVACGAFGIEFILRIVNRTHNNTWMLWAVVLVIGLVELCGRKPEKIK